MSVVRSQRSTSDMQFLMTARELQLFTIRKCVNFPKRYTFYVNQPLAAIATRIFEDVKRGNSIYPSNQHEAQLRRDFFLHALSELQNMVSQLEVACELFSVEPEIVRNWSSLINAEINLVKAVMKSDKVRYKNLP